MHIRNKFLCFALILGILLSLVPMTLAAANDSAYVKTFLPGFVESENYDIGADGSYSVDGVNTGGAYRPKDPMDIYSADGKTYLQLNAGEFANYTVISEYDGIYNIYVDFITSGELKLYIDDNETPIRAIAQGMTGKTFSSAVRLRKGTHILKITSNAKVQFDKLIIESAKNQKVVFDPEVDYLKTDEEDEVKNEIYKEFYVSLSGSDEFEGSKEKPFKTLTRAQEEVRKFNKNMTGDIYVYIEPGYHKLSEALNFTAEDGGADKYNVVYKGTTPFSESVIGGGNLITGWEKTDNELYKAYYDSPNDFRNLYINDVPAVRAMTKYIYKPSKYFKNDNSEYEYDGMKFSRRNFPSEFYDITRAEAVWTVEWINYRLPIKNIVYEEKEVVMEMEQPWFNLMATNKNTSAVKKEASVYFENDLKFLDEPGEFYYDIKNKMVYYYPREGEKLENVYACDTEYLINAQGTKEDNIKNLHFERLSFKHGAFYETNEGYHHGQAHNISRPGVATKPLPAQLDFKHVKGLVIKDCKLIGLGSTAIGMTNGVTDSKIIGNLIKEVSGHAIMLGRHNHLDKMPEGHVRVSDIIVKNNVIRRAAREFRDCPAIHLFYVKNITITHNDIEEVCYSGISVGWGWGKDIKETGDHTISYNRVVDVMGPTHDGGHIYTLSPIRNTKIFRNYFKDTNDYRGGLYFDNGSAYIEAYENVLSVAGNWIWAREDASLSNLTVYNNWHYSEEEGIDPKAVTTYGNILEKDGAKDKWSVDAQAVIDNAGVETSYKRLLKEAEIPEYAKGYMRDLPNGFYPAKNDWISPGSYVDFYDIDASKPEIYTSGSIGNTVEGEWCEYDINILENGTYKFSIKAGNGDKKQQPKVKLYIDGKVVEEDLVVPMWKENKWTIGEIEGQEYYLEKGVHRIRIEHKDGNFMFGPFKFSMGGVRSVSDPEYDEGKLPSDIVDKKDTVFTDIIKHWAYDDIIELYENGIIKGVSGTEFAPDREISLYEAIILMMRASGYDETKWQEKLASFEMTGCLKNVGNAVSREAFCNLIMKFYADLKGPFAFTADYKAYKDFESISTDYSLSVWGAKEYGFMNGDEKGNFNPKKSLTRAEAAAVVLRYKNTVK